MKLKYLILVILALFNTDDLFSQCSDTINFGDNRWIVKAYDARKVNQISSTNYKGFYTQKLDNSGNYGVNTTLQWPSTTTGKPSVAAAFNSTNGTGTVYRGCSIPSQYFSYVHSRKGFPAGQYEVYVDAWDDSTVLYLDGQLIVNLSQYGSNSYALRCISLNQNSTLEIRTDNSGGGVSQLRMRIIPVTLNVRTNDDFIVCRGDTANINLSASIFSTITNNTNNITNQLNNITWTGPNVISGQGTTSLRISPSANSNYTVTLGYQYCRFTESTAVSIYLPVGDPTEFGDNTWNVYGYKPAQNIATNNLTNQRYYGYYTQNLNSSVNLGFTTNLISNDGWAQNGRPSNSQTWQGCDLASNDNFTYVHKRKGFPCGTYKLTLTNWDRNTLILINGVQVHTSTTACTGTNCLVDLGNVELDANSTVEIRSSQTTGSSVTKLSIVPVTSTDLGLNNQSKTCPVKGMEWVDFYHHPSGRYLASVRGTTPTTDLGNVTVTSYVDNEGQLAYACENIDLQTALMQRHWVINAEQNNIAEIRLPYLDSEFRALDTRSISSSNPADRVTYPSQPTVKMTKYSGPSNVNNLVTDNCGGLSTMFTSQNNSFNINTYHYQDFIIPGFSEFWLHGMDYVSALPITIEKFGVNCTDYGQEISFSAIVEKNTDKIILEKSIDGQQWEEIMVESFSQANSEYQTYSHWEPSTRSAYYRIKTLDRDGALEFHPIISSKCSGNQSAINIYPNPSTDYFNVSLENATELKSNALMTIVDVTGKIIYSKELQLNTGTTDIPVNTSNYAKGSYTVKILDQGQNNWLPQKVIIQ